MDLTGMLQHLRLSALMTLGEIPVVSKTKRAASKAATRTKKAAGKAKRAVKKAVKKAAKKVSRR